MTLEKQEQHQLIKQRTKNDDGTNLTRTLDPQRALKQDAATSCSEKLRCSERQTKRHLCPADSQIVQLPGPSYTVPEECGVGMIPVMVWILHNIQRGVTSSGIGPSLMQDQCSVIYCGIGPSLMQ